MDNFEELEDMLSKSLNEDMENGTGVDFSKSYYSIDEIAEIIRSALCAE